jgi:serine/threonine-protein kinase HipA
MSLPKLNILMRKNNGWEHIATITLLGSEKDGEKSATRLEYDIDYAVRESGKTAAAALSVLHPVSLESKVLPTWPSFLLDLLPQGHAMKFVEKYYKIADQKAEYWNILSTCLLFPPGNIRVSISQENPLLKAKTKASNGFSIEEVVSKGEHFLEHMLAAGAPVAGTTGASGAAPKFLLREDLNGRFHADSALADANTKKMWFVKFPRGKAKSDFDILKTEAAVHQAAGLCGIKTHGTCFWRNNTLFLERFDRTINAQGGIDYLGLESFYSAVGSVTFGEFRAHEEYLEAIARFSSSPEEDIAEYLARDLLSLMIGNTDNHGRNSSFLKTENEVRIAPLYDMAPMAWDSEGIVRSTRWKNPDENWAVALASNAFSRSFSKHRFARNLENKYTGLQNLWNALETSNSTTPFLKHGIQAKTMANIVMEAQKKLAMLKREL